MNYLESYTLFEARQRSNLYHIFDLSKCMYILKNNKISSYKFGNISTTRNKQMNGYIGDSPISIFKLELDGDKITNNYKVRPFQFQSSEGPERRPIKLKEYEEVIKTREIKDINKYVKKFIIIKDRVESMMGSWFDSDGGNVNGKRVTIPGFFKEYLPKVRELFGEIWVQDGSVIKKDDEWVEMITNHKIKQIHHGYALYWRGHKRIKHKKFGIILKDDVVPVDDRNSEIENLVIGYHYENLYLQKSDEFELPRTNKPDGYQLYMFNMIYKIEDIVEETDDYVFVKKAKIKMPRILDKNNKWL